MFERPIPGVVIWALAAAIAGLALWRLMAGGGPPPATPIRVDRAPPEAGARRAPADRGLFVHVAGAVRRPGLVRVPAGSRVEAAVVRAGGAGRRADLAGVNLAAPVEDGQQVIVPVRAGASASAAIAAGGLAPEPGAPGVPKLSLGSATIDQLEELDGIGPTLAERIIEYRIEQGGFGSLEELREVDGIGEERLESLSEAVQP